ncbi:hypothetical protein Bbelb_014500 [Branchiostoma belcheri]|nr:hypothetical protein Bbelb_014500 [Branchiostoma belcheri]
MLPPLTSTRSKATPLSQGHPEKEVNAASKQTLHSGYQADKCELVQTKADPKISCVGPLELHYSTCVPIRAAGSNRREKMNEGRSKSGPATSTVLSRVPVSFPLRTSGYPHLKISVGETTGQKEGRTEPLFSGLPPRFCRMQVRVPADHDVDLRSWEPGMVFKLTPCSHAKVHLPSGVEVIGVKYQHALLTLNLARRPSVLTCQLKLQTTRSRAAWCVEFRRAEAEHVGGNRLIVTSREGWRTFSGLAALMLSHVPALTAARHRARSPYVPPDWFHRRHLFVEPRHRCNRVHPGSTALAFVCLAGNTPRAGLFSLPVFLTSRIKEKVAGIHLSTSSIMADTETKGARSAPTCMCSTVWWYRLVVFKPRLRTFCVVLCRVFVPKTQFCLIEET